MNNKQQTPDLVETIEERRARKHRERSQEYYYRNREKRITATREWQKRHSAEVNGKVRQYRLQIRLECLEHYSQGKPHCACCGEAHIEFLGIDHISGGGSQARKERGHGNIYQWLKGRGYPDGYRVLCHNCNMSIGFYGYCPHQKEKENE